MASRMLLTDAIGSPCVWITSCCGINQVWSKGYRSMVLPRRRPRSCARHERYQPRHAAPPCQVGYGDRSEKFGLKAAWRTRAGCPPASSSCATLKSYRAIPCRDPLRRVHWDNSSSEIGGVLIRAEGLEYGRGRRRTPCTTLNSAVVRPIGVASVRGLRLRILGYA